MPLVLLLAAALFRLAAQEQPSVTFGTTVVSTAGLQGDIYLLKPGTEYLPKFNKAKSVGSIFTTSLRITPRQFRNGFPGITERFEWFAINYTGRFWIETAGRYQFRVLSDDGSKLWIGDSLVVDNDGVHSPMAITGSAVLSRGVHHLRLAYFQGPRVEIALVLSIAEPNSNDWSIFDTTRFQPPADVKQWVPGKVSQVKKGANW